MLPLQDLGFNLNKREFRDAVQLRYDWPVRRNPLHVCLWEGLYGWSLYDLKTIGGFITQHYNELSDVEAEFLNVVCSDVEIEPVLQDISGEHFEQRI